ncbi:interferon-related developmental regulator 2-like [Rhopilema esculentum]|uniref:interferon-related developmental regulator 2-like n=1 Tax=Rhopilema esculentum TaxID=499914 RepID=UPI0031DB2F5E
MESARSRKAKSAKRQRVVKKGKKAESGANFDDGNDSDSGSIASSVSTAFSEDLDADFQGDVDEVGDDIEQILIDNIEGASAKSAKERQSSIKEVKRCLCRKYTPEFIDGRKDTLLDVVERLLKRGQTADKAAVANLGSLLCLQLGAANSLNVYRTLKPLLVTVINDTAQSFSARSSCALALGMCCFIGSEELGEVTDCMNVLRNVFSKKAKEIATDEGLMSSSVLSWGLLLTVASNAAQNEAIEENLEKLYRLLENGKLGLRLATGEVIALIYELGRELDETFDMYVDGLYDLLKELATDSSKYKAKREKRQQRSTFRDVLKTVESGMAPAEKVKFGIEKIELSSWTRIRQYNALKDSLGPGIATHLQENVLLREIFGLGAPLINREVVSKEDRWGKMLQNAAAEKERTKNRSKGRENKRAAAAHGF